MNINAIYAPSDFKCLAQHKYSYQLFERQIQIHA